MSSEAKVQMLEAFAVPDIFASGLGDIEHVGGGCLRFVLYSQQQIGDRTERVVVCRLIVPVEAVPLMMRTTSKELGICICEAKGVGVAVN